MKKLIYIFFAVILFASCEKALMDEDPKVSNSDVFDYLWTRIDENYSLFDVKKVDWDQVRDTYRPQAIAARSDEELFDVLSRMLNTLDDAHVNLYSSFDASRSERYFVESHARCNIDIHVVALNYLKYNYHSLGGFAYNTIRDGSVLYVRYGSFSGGASKDDWVKILNDNYNCRGVILDVRQNGGGLLENVLNLVSIFPSSGQQLYLTQIKNGPRHDDFSTLEICTAPTNSSHEPYTKPVVVLTDRGSFSATSFFALACRAYSNVYLMGDTTGGGLGTPTSGQLPNGWFYRHSITRTLSPQRVNYENGVPPHKVVLLASSATDAGIDNVIEAACDYIIAH